jgi:phosphotriesterase-related protein
MNRRDFLKSAVLVMGASKALAGPLASQAEVNTVLGPVPASSLGQTLMHEHVLVDFVGAEKIAPGRYDAQEVVRIVLPHLQEAKSLGCETLVECTPAYLGRDPRLLARLSQASGLHIITNTGFYGAAGGRYVPRLAYSETAEQLAARWTREFTDGIPPLGIPPGFIKTGVDAGPLSAINTKLLSAAALTHLRMGLVIASHTGDGIAAMAQLALLKKYGVPPSAFIWVHAQNEKDLSLHRRAAAEGAWVEFDGISEETLEKHKALVLEMRRAGFLHRVLLAQDAGWYHVGEPGGGSFRDYGLLFSRFLPELREAGLSPSEIQILIAQNPRQALLPTR